MLRYQLWVCIIYSISISRGKHSKSTNTAVACDYWAIPVCLTHTTNMPSSWCHRIYLNKAMWQVIPHWATHSTGGIALAARHWQTQLPARQLALWWGTSKSPSGLPCPAPHTSFRPCVPRGHSAAPALPPTPPCTCWRPRLSATRGAPRTAPKHPPCQPPRQRPCVSCCRPRPLQCAALAAAPAARWAHGHPSTSTAHPAGQWPDLRRPTGRHQQLRRPPLLRR